MDRQLLVLVFCSVLLFSANLGGTSIYILDEAKNSEAAREMLETHSIVPTFNYELRTDKPPLHYFFMMAAYEVFGVNEFAARFFSALMGLLLIVCIYLFIRKWLDAQAALWTCVVMLSSIQIVIQFHMAVPDPYLICFFTTAMFAFYNGLTLDNRWWIYLGYFLLGLAVLSKGPVALALAGLSIFLFLLLTKRFTWSTIQSFRLIEGTVIFLLITLPWYIAVHIQTNGAWTEGFFLKHNLSRFTSAMEGHGGSFLLMPLYVIMGLFPFSLFIFHAIRFVARHRMNDIMIYCGVVSAVIIVFFCFSRTKLPSYPAISFPFVATILGTYLASRTIEWRKSMTAVMVLYIVICVAIPVAVFILLDDVMHLSSLRNLAYGFVLLPVGAIVALIMLRRNKPVQMVASIGISWFATTLLFFYIIFPPVDRNNPVLSGLSMIKKESPVYYYGSFNPSFSFYLQKRIRSFDEVQSPGKAITVISQKRNLTDLKPLEDQYTIEFSQREFFEPYYSIVLWKKNESMIFYETTKRTR